MTILTDEEIESCSNFSHNRYQFARAIEAAVLSKLAEQDVEPVADVVWYDPTIEPFQKVKPHKIIDGSLSFMDEARIGTKLYTEPQLIAAQQRTAEACARVCRGEGIGFADDDEELNRIAAMLDAGKWREYL